VGARIVADVMLASAVITSWRSRCFSTRAFSPATSNVAGIPCSVRNTARRLPRRRSAAGCSRRRQTREPRRRRLGGSLRLGPLLMSAEGGCGTAVAPDLAPLPAPDLAIARAPARTSRQCPPSESPLPMQQSPLSIVTRSRHDPHRLRRIGRLGKKGGFICAMAILAMQGHGRDARGTCKQQHRRIPDGWNWRDKKSVRDLAN